MPHRQTRTKRFNLRATGRQDELIRAAARIRGANVSEFILESACSRAEQAVADQAHFVLSKDKWNEFLKALDRPARVKPELRRLFAEKTILEEDDAGGREAKTVSSRKARQGA
jgi:uncharacterized protein (DUF1778 family)